jgi:bifunctional non-homologous end joining protein LigD
LRLSGAGRYFAVMISRRVLPVGFVEPCIPTLAAKPPSGPDWVHEIKHDGYRLMVRRDGDTVRLFTRRGHDWTDRYSAIASAAANLRAKSFTMDGEAVVTGADGVAVFDALHRRHKATNAMLYAFDLLELNGEDLRPLPLAKRKAKLARLLARKPLGIVFNEHTDEDGATVFRHACKLGLEGIVSKRLSPPYRSGPSRDWIKMKNPARRCVGFAPGHGESSGRSGRPTTEQHGATEQSSVSSQPPIAKDPSRYDAPVRETAVAEKDPIQYYGSIPVALVHVWKSGEQSAMADIEAAPTVTAAHPSSAATQIHTSHAAPQDGAARAAQCVSGEADGRPSA